ncbi:uncharacterized protein LOC131975473 [Centropristis striata]|uniref:uncharacterized protein LOC131975473 n=1 Tax=Centropristis striata TaxID=184440 RepID=UPI0027E14ECC|nr:uncharacterized protein LOC131975473 [Centropristis striata]
MDCNSSTKDSKTPTLRRIKTSEKQIQAGSSADKQLLDSHDKLTTGQKPLSKPGLPLEKKVEQAKQRRNFLINEHNRQKFAVKEKEAKLKTLQESLKTKNLQPKNYNSEAACKQRIRQLENNLDKMKMKMTEANEIQTAYRHIRDHLQQEVRDMYSVLEHKEHAVATGQAEVDKATKELQSAAAAAGSTLNMVVEMEHEMMGKISLMDMELCELSAEEKELKRQMKALGCVRATPSRLKEPEVEEEEEEEEAHSSPVTAHQCKDSCGASQCDLRLVEDMDSLREALSCAHVQELVNKVVSQRATREQLLSELSLHEELSRQEAEALDHLELQYTQLKFSAKPAATRFEQLKAELQTRLKEEVSRVDGLRAELKQSEDLLVAVEQGVNNLYFRMSCIPVEGSSRSSSTESRDKMREICARLPILLQIASEHKPETSGLDQDKVYSVFEQLNSMQPRNIRRRSSPAGTPQLSDDEEESSPSREEIKRCSIRLIETEQNKKLSRKGKRKE